MGTEAETVVVPNDAITNALRGLNFTFKKQTDRMMVWRQRGTQVRVLVRRNASHDEEYARTLLRQAGMPEHEIQAFLNSCNN